MPRAVRLARRTHPRERVVQNPPAPARRSREGDHRRPDQSATGLTIPEPASREAYFFPASSNTAAVIDVTHVRIVGSGTKVANGE